MIKTELVFQNAIIMNVNNRRRVKISAYHFSEL